jgi:hypothetical protein
MGKTFSEISEELKDWISEQKMFVVATAPLADDGFINCSPKGLDAFRILNPLQVAYLDLVGSGIETVAHLRENGRIVLMFSAFKGAPQIVRLHGDGQAIFPDDDRFGALAEKFPSLPGIRSIILIDVTRVSRSCGYGVPLYDYRGDRKTLVQWAEKKSTKELSDYQASKNQTSIDGLPGISIREQDSRQ